VLTDTELKAVWTPVRLNPLSCGAFTRLLILTAARELEVADLTAGEVDLQQADGPSQRTGEERDLHHHPPV
jgi:hypothetical protein